MLKTIFNLEIDYKNRVFGLDIIRTVAVLLVVLGHSDRLLGKTLDYHPVLRWLFKYVFVFYLDGVDLFFVLSGFLIGGILIKIIQQNDHFTFSILRHFWKRRWLRTLPNYYLILIANLVLWFFITTQEQRSFSWQMLSDLQVFKYLFFVQNLYQPCPPFFTESWSLAVEEWFYLLLPLFFMLLLGIAKGFGLIDKVGTKSQKKRIILLTLGTFLLAATLLRFYKVSFAVLPISTFDAGNLYRTIVLPRLDSLMFGVFGAFIKYFYSTFWHKIKISAFVLGIFIIYFLKISSHNQSILSSIFDLYLFTTRLSVQSLAILCLFPLIDNFSQIKSSFFRTTVTYISLASYSVYLLNLLLINTITHFISPLFPQTYFYESMIYVSFWIILVGLSIVIYKYFEKPIMLLRE